MKFLVKFVVIKVWQGFKICCYTSLLKYVFRLEDSCDWLKLTNSLRRTKLTNSPAKQLEVSTLSDRVPYKRGKFVCQESYKIIFRSIFSIFKLSCINLLTGLSGVSEFCFPSTSMLRVSGKQNLLFIKCSLPSSALIDDLQSLKIMQKWTLSVSSFR